MFARNRFVIVDDRKKHLKALRRALEGLGCSCVTVHYDVEKAAPVPATPFHRVRVIFMDLQLRNYMHASDHRADFAVIQGILEKVMPTDAGPFLMVLWTTRPDQAEELEAYLRAGLEDLPHALPMKVIPLSKHDVIDLDTGAADDPGKLREAIVQRVQSVPALAALLQWESEVIAASDRVARDVVELARVSGDEGDLACTLGRLTVEAVGAKNVADDPQAAVHAALLPLLQDHIQYDLIGDPDAPKAWGDLFHSIPVKIPPLPREAAAQLNSQLHLGRSSLALTAVTWGAICEIPASTKWSAEFGIESKDAFVKTLLDHVRIVKGGIQPDPTKVHPLQIRIGPSCDYAQRKPGPIPYVLGAFVPISEAPKNAAAGQPKAPSSSKKSPVLGPWQLAQGSTLWASPLLTLPWGTGQIFVDPRFIKVRGEGSAKRLTVVDRLREQLLLHLISAVSYTGARPGIVAFAGQDPPQ